MEIKFGKQVAIQDIKNKEIDLFLLAGNHEHRVFTAFQAFNKNNIKRSIILCYKASFETKAKDMRTIVIKNTSQIYSLLDEELLNISKEAITIAIDYSCMTKSWYYSIILYLTKKNIDLKKIIVYFIYTPSKYSDPQEPKPNTEIAPLPGKYIVPTDKPKALIVCLGYEQSKAEGIIEHLDPKISYIFYTKPALDPKFVDALEKNNQDILKGNSNIITFPFDNLLVLERELTSIYNKLKNDYSVIIAPLGPKPFTFISMMMSVKYNDIDIWRVGSGSDINEYERKPLDNKSFIISEVNFIG